MDMTAWSNDRRKGKIYPRKCIQYYERNIKKRKSKNLMGLNLSEDIPSYTSHYISGAI